ncbi:lipoteichoic acid synthase-like YqgS [Halolactibacillus alkaliphilus]|uniref:Lipoteichoic acid synthase-like YqgS n=1 Tax=Halolactibacillus alkaliphilus TaxID=442899 RepID=A0A511X2U7_9BACI|nr:LTA synthase family protein [Halolactibacillus alkaliphilus]GEN57258.1 lipoteichoic acid synthase-like YqgS [Halolactibacillus alkaliphilus]GGN68946.1 lipoteichoic acid synthase-like YqgS [Halolactibacillus alkaliphilus]SFO73377.1 uncharacterized sulfatase [Halolactibacillus alkaliphilus]
MFKKQNINQLFVIASILFGAKTYVIYRFLFNINLENTMQEFILFINPFVTAFFVYALSVWFKPKHQTGYIKTVTILGSVILYLNLIFYRNFGDFLTIPILFQGSNAKDLGSSVISLLEWYDVLLFADVALIFYLAKPSVNIGEVAEKTRPKGRKLILSLSIVFLIGNYVLAEIERPQLLQRGFDREYLVKNIGLFNFHLYDIVQQSRSKAQRVLADGNELSEILTYIDEEATDRSTTDLAGIAEGKNVIFVWLESLQTFVINNELHGEEITPFLNSLIDDSYYFENFYHQTEQGKTADSEFVSETSLYPLPSGAVYFTHGDNTYQSLPQMLGESGYSTSVFHANNGSFWNRNVMYGTLGIDHFYDINAYNVTDDNTVGWGLKDKDFFEQSMKYLTSLQEPYYTRMITLTNHHPFSLDEEDATLMPFDSNSRTLNQYFQTVRYLDESLELFFDELKAAGEYDDAIIVLMGDHYGISDFHDRAMAMYLDKEEITPYDHIQLQRVPLYIHIPGEKGEVISTVSGQVDIKPTLLHLLGIEDDNELGFGTNMFGENRKDFIALRDGSFITEDVIYTKGLFYDRVSGELIEETDVLLELKERAQQELTYSDQLIYGDLLRFHDLNQ